MTNYKADIDKIRSVEDFKSLFPYLGEGGAKYVFLFTLKDKRNILFSSNVSIILIDEMVNRIRKIDYIPEQIELFINNL
jgi:hypothetical protein